MSRRICTFALVAAALIVTPAIADRECFEDTCRQPEPIEPRAQSDAPSEAADASEPQALAAPMPSPADTPPPAARAPMSTPAAGTPAPSTTQPQMVVDPAPRTPLRPMPRYAGDEPPKRSPARSAERGAGETGASPRVAGDADLARPAARVSAHASAAASDSAQRQAYGRAAVIQVPGAVSAEDGVVTVYPHVQPDPSWKLCQIDQRGGQRRYQCGPYSYHPYGAYGYRPYGSHRAYRSAPVYVYAPDARIITIETDD
jgi:hypothetical protein